MPERIPVRDLVAAIDQLRAGLGDVARLLGGYRSELIAAGFSPDEALELCRDIQLNMLLEPE